VADSESRRETDFFSLNSRDGVKEPCLPMTQLLKVKEQEEAISWG